MRHKYKSAIERSVQRNHLYANFTESTDSEFDSRNFIFTGIPCPILLNNTNRNRTSVETNAKMSTPTFSLQGQTACPFIRCPKSKQAPIDKNLQARGKKLQHPTRQVSHLPTGRRGG
ncbi:hypothetical protein TNIN_252861 [Trichonephila inaurata madagascariensis]|uniref:Uncharacterized protein n=1 Tax=Trichonephila inaurata madagascariensis TaxID=2747483 RepID=A0A8X6XP31_9ARAC|nr:hypothetical protein TNIN_252861 [Trichonephila inaurata madagascariensis]